MGRHVVYRCFSNVYIQLGTRCNVCIEQYLHRITFVAEYTVLSMCHLQTGCHMVFWPVELQYSQLKAKVCAAQDQQRCMK